MKGCACAFEAWFEESTSAWLSQVLNAGENKRMDALEARQAFHMPDRGGWYEYFGELPGAGTPEGAELILGHLRECVDLWHGLQEQSGCEKQMGEMRRLLAQMEVMKQDMKSVGCGGWGENTFHQIEDGMDSLGELLAAYQKERKDDSAQLKEDLAEAKAELLAACFPPAE